MLTLAMFFFYFSHLSSCIQLYSAYLNDWLKRNELGHLQEEPLVLAAVDLLGRLNQLLGGVYCLTASQQLTVQGLQFALLLLLHRSRPLVISLRQRLQHVVVVLLQVLLLAAKILLYMHVCDHRDLNIRYALNKICTEKTNEEKMTDQGRR